jgi:hypothetical protein
MYQTIEWVNYEQYIQSFGSFDKGVVGGLLSTPPPPPHTHTHTCAHPALPPRSTRPSFTMHPATPPVNSVTQGWGQPMTKSLVNSLLPEYGPSSYTMDFAINPRLMSCSLPLLDLLPDYTARLPA